MHGMIGPGPSYMSLRHAFARMLARWLEAKSAWANVPTRAFAVTVHLFSDVVDCCNSSPSAFLWRPFDAFVSQVFSNRVKHLSKKLCGLWRLTTPTMAHAVEVCLTVPKVAAPVLSTTTKSIAQHWQNRDKVT